MGSQNFFLRFFTLFNFNIFQGLASFVDLMDNLQTAIDEENDIRYEYFSR